MIKFTGNSGEIAHAIIQEVLGRRQERLGEEDLAVDADEAIDLPWEDNSFATLEADPPWSYDDNGFNGFQTVQEYRIHCPYRTMRFRNILAAGAEVKRVMKANAHCYLWTTKDFLLEALVTMRAWGFNYKNMIVWLKTSREGRLTYGMGHWYRNAWEAMLFGVRGNPGRPFEATSQPNWLCAPKPKALLVPDGKGGFTKHSRKPQEAYDLICRNSPGPRLSMFQRGDRDGFYCWGDEATEGLTREWSGEKVEYDDTLAFGIDYDAGDVSVLLSKEEIDEVRIAFQLAKDGYAGELTQKFLAVGERFDQAGEVLDGIESARETGEGGEEETEIIEAEQDEESIAEELVQDLGPSADDVERWRNGMSEEAWKEAVEKGWIDCDE